MRKFRNYKEDLFKDLKDPEFAAAISMPLWK
jgi:hypothetical protein